MKRAFWLKTSAAALTIIFILGTVLSFPTYPVQIANAAAASDTTAKKLAGSLTLDGKLDDSVWSINTKVGKAVSGKPDNTVTFGTLWDSKYLYIGVKVLDSKLCSSSKEIADNDSVTVCIDPNDPSTVFSEDGRVFTKAYGSTVVKEANNNIDGVKCDWAAVKGGYTVEMAVPWTDFGIVPTAGHQIGLEIYNNDNDNKKGIDNRLSWFSKVNVEALSTFGKCALSSQTVGKASKPGLAYKPLHPYKPVPAPDFTLSDVNGKSVKLSSLKGKKVMLVFFATWCGACRVELPFTNSFNKQKPSDTVLFVIANGQGKGDVEPFLNETGYTFRVLCDTDASVTNKYIDGMPTTVLIDKKGLIRYKLKGTLKVDQLQRIISKIP